jgi:hypothetical protein
MVPKYVLIAMCLVAAPALGSPVLYTFGVTQGSMAINVAGQGSTHSGIAGTFALTLYQGEVAHIGESDTFLLEDIALTNTGTMAMNLAGLARAYVHPGSARLLDFAPGGPAHIGPAAGALVETDVYAEATTFITGLTSTTFTSRAWAGTLLPFNMTFTSSAGVSDVVTAALGGTYRYSVGISDIGLTLTLDLIISAEGTAHVVPDPALAGFTVMGVGGAGAWLRLRRR